MRRRAGIQGELLLSLGLVMVLATVVQAGVLVVHHERSVRHLVGRALTAEARVPGAIDRALVPGTEWWTVHGDGRVEPRNALAGAVDADGRALAEEALRRGEVLLRPGAPWERIQVAVPLERRGVVALAAVPRSASFRLRFSALGVLGVVLLADVLIFTALGVSLVRGRVVVPLQRLAASARAIAHGASGVRAPVAGTAEAADLANSFNEMTDALEARSAALEKAVVELRESNRELRETRAGLDRAERLAATGQLAAGVAHEVGNPIGAILALVDLAARDPGLSDAGRAHLGRAGREGLRVRTILRQLLDFSRPPRPTLVPLDLGAVAEEAAALVRAQPRYGGVRFDVVRAADAPIARGDPSAALQILVNLALNAGDAARSARDGAGSRVRLWVRPAALRARRGEGPGAAGGRRAPDAVECVVADDGPGIAPEDRERIFDAYFTSKPPGEGTGLGLANAVRLAEEQGGTVELVEPPPGFCTAFALRLPACAPATPAGARGATPAGAQSSSNPTG